MLAGYKTYIVAALGLVYQIYHTQQTGQPLDLNAMLGFLGLGALRAAVPPKA